MELSFYSGWLAPVEDPFSAMRSQQAPSPEDMTVMQAKVSDSKELSSAAFGRIGPR
jgi:hypothetical protein